MLVLAPVMCILSGIGVSQVLSTYMKNLDISRPDKKSKKQQDSTYPIKNEVRSNVKSRVGKLCVCVYVCTWVVGGGRSKVEHCHRWSELTHGASDLF